MSKKGRNSLRSVSLLVLFGVYQCSAQYVLDVMRATYSGEEELVMKCPATGGNFGFDVGEFIITENNLGCGAGVVPADACGPITIGNHSTTCRNQFAFVSRSNYAHPCKFSHQAFMVQNSTYNFRLVIFYNYPGQDPISMEGAELRDKVILPVIMISHACKEEIVKKYSDTAGYRLRVRIDPGYYELFRYLIPFLVVIVFCFALFLITLCVRSCVERRKLNKRRLSKRNLKKIPVKKYRLGDDPDTCAICLESFAPGEKLRHLPCRHVFHCNCIDVWLTQTRKICPLCKRKIGSDSDSECSTSDLASTSQAPNDSLALFRSSEQSGFDELVVPSGPMLDLWSSQEALVDQDIVLLNAPRRSLFAYVRGAIRRWRHSPGTDQNQAGLEHGSYLVRQQAQSNDSDHLLENEVSDPTTSSEVDISTSTTTDISTENTDTTPTNETISSPPTQSCQ